ncbi:unnamed protein product [Ectocarpus sp. CCAP 1310/34]|nr:unnamed protein product [Ectocarpus sp. CCAP 1310/34]
MPVDAYDPEKDEVYWWVVLSTVLTWILAVVAAAADTWFQSGNFSLGDECYGGGGFCARYATATAFQYIATLACSAAVLLLALSAFAKGYGGEIHSPVEGVRGAGQPPPWRSGLISSRELGRAGVWGLLVFTVAEILVFIVMTDLRNRDLSAISRGDAYNCAITATVFAIVQAFALSRLRDHGTFNGGIVYKENTAHDVGRYCTVYNAYHAVIVSALLITWPFAVEGAAGNQWVGSPVALALGGTCRVYSSDDFCPGYYIATLIQYLATVVCSCAVVALALATMIERPVGSLVPDVLQRQELVKTGAWGLLCYAATQLLAFAVVAGIKEECENVTLGRVSRPAFQKAQCPLATTALARFGPQQNGFQSVHYWRTAASSMITFLFSVIIAVDDGWLRDRGKLDSCTNSDEEHCGTYKAAVDFQKLATCCCSFAFAMLVGSAIAPTKTREASSETSTYLGWLGGCSLVLYALTQLVVLCMMSGIRNRCELLPGGRGFFSPPVRCWHPGRSFSDL